MPLVSKLNCRVYKRHLWDFYKKKNEQERSLLVNECQTKI